MSETEVRPQFLSSVFIVPQNPLQKPFPRCMLRWIMSNAFIWGQLPSILLQQSLAVYIYIKISAYCIPKVLLARQQHVE